ncbi:class I SAM-dependent methyltransferase [Pleionea sediminis]|uniref:class I SAM-dependent methyltransferase n=1 Tax=Pleionea sediminis TaxID=2569479 RepID=UPI001186A939|nr:methyltransferase [Pleionea sediminis]
MTHFETPYGSFEFIRYPKAHDPTLKAWDAADDLALKMTTGHLPQNGIVVIANDEFGALSVPLSSQHQVFHWSDSLLSQMAVSKNTSNHSTNNLELLNSTSQLPKVKPNLIILRPPKIIQYLNYQLKTLRSSYPNTQIIIPVMQKFITTGMKSCISQHVDHVNPGRAQRKARVIEGSLKSDLPSNEQENFSSFRFNNLTLFNMPNVFSAQSLDIGARFLLENFPDLTDAKHIADLGCGNGVLSAFGASHYPNSRFYGFDESYMAISSARETFRQNQLSNGTFTVSNVFSHTEETSYDAILCNPPFHQNRRVTTDTAKLMFKQSSQLINKEGKLWVIANRHLDYDKVLNRYFNTVNKVKENHKFVILSAKK